MIEMLSLYEFHVLLLRKGPGGVGKWTRGGRVKIMYNFDDVYQYTEHYSAAFLCLFLSIP